LLYNKMNNKLMIILIVGAISFFVIGIILLFALPIPCKSGTYSLTGKTGWFGNPCTICPENTYSYESSTQCINCPKGTISSPGSSDIAFCIPDPNPGPNPNPEPEPEPEPGPGPEPEPDPEPHPEPEPEQTPSWKVPATFTKFIPKQQESVGYVCNIDKVFTSEGHNDGGKWCSDKCSMSDKCTGYSFNSSLYQCKWNEVPTFQSCDDTTITKEYSLQGKNWNYYRRDKNDPNPNPGPQPECMTNSDCMSSSKRVCDTGKCVACSATDKTFCSDPNNMSCVRGSCMQVCKTNAPCYSNDLGVLCACPTGKSCKPGKDIYGPSYCQ
jgi:hypothetical protein